MSDEIQIEGITYVSSKRAAQTSAYTQDYIGQLSRGGLIDARRIGNLWYVSLDSLMKYKEKADTYTPVPPQGLQNAAPEHLLSFDGNDYVSALKAAEITGYHQDYVGQLARSGTVLSRQVGTHWYVEKEGITSHKAEKDRLLGAVQAESVGVVRPAVSPEEAPEEGPYLTYTPDTRELLPTLPDVEREAVGEGRILPEESDSEHAIPIRVLRVPTPVFADVQAPILRRKKMDASRITTKTLVIPASLLIMVLLVSAGLFFSRQGSVYTQEVPKERSLASTGGPLDSLEKIGAILEKVLTKELVYKRSKE